MRKAGDEGRRREEGWRGTWGRKTWHTSGNRNVIRWSNFQAALPSSALEVEMLVIQSHRSNEFTRNKIQELVKEPQPLTWPSHSPFYPWWHRPPKPDQQFRNPSSRYPSPYPSYSPPWSLIPVPDRLWSILHSRIVGFGFGYGLVYEQAFRRVLDNDLNLYLPLRRIWFCRRRWVVVRMTRRRRTRTLSRTKACRGYTVLGWWELGGLGGRDERILGWLPLLFLDDNVVVNVVVVWWGGVVVWVMDGWIDGWINGLMDGWIVFRSRKKSGVYLSILFHSIA